MPWTLSIQLTKLKTGSYVLRFWAELSHHFTIYFYLITNFNYIVFHDYSFK